MRTKPHIFRFGGIWGYFGARGPGLGRLSEFWRNSKAEEHIRRMNAPLWEKYSPGWLNPRTGIDTRPGRSSLAEQSAREAAIAKAENVIPLGCVTKLDIPVDRVLEEAKGTLSGVVLLGWKEDGDMFFASSISDGGDVLWLMEQAKAKLLAVMEST